jgi:multidrug efflux pump subunit AcrA (membrane-fusion protein)
MKRFVRRRFLIAYAVIAVLLGTGTFLMVRGSSAGVQYRTTAAVLGTVTQTVSLSGNLTSATQSLLDFTSAGRVSAVDVQVGQNVDAGTSLATLDTTALQASLSTAQATLQSAQARLSLDLQGATAQSLASANGQVSSAQVTLQNDQTNLTDVQNANQLAVSQAQTQYSQSDGCGSPQQSATCQKDWDQLQSMQQKATQSNDQAQGQLSAAQVQLQNAQAALAALEQGTSSQQIAMDRSQVQIDQVNVQSAQTALSNATLVAPAAGVVAQVNVVAGQQVSAGSASAAASSSTTHAVVVVSPGLFNVTGSVSDAQVNQIAVGQQAQVLPAGSQEAVVGQVTQVAQEATITSGVATFPVTVTLTGSNPSLRAGMSASVSVVVNQVVHVLTVPTSAVHSSAAGATVQVLVNGQSQTRSVQVGASDALRTQILSGVNADDQVIIATITSTVPSNTGNAGRNGGLNPFGGGGGGGRGAAGGGPVTVPNGG